MGWPQGHALLFGRYRVTRRLGQGCNGEVWAARDGVTGDEVAVKVGHHSGASRWSERRELAALQLLRLPGVVRLLDEGEVLGPDGSLRSVLVMERVEGVSFPGRDGVTGWEILRPCVVALLRVLRRVHQAGVVHRDLKPGHVVLRPDRPPTLLDFGAACGVGVSVAPRAGAWEVGSLAYAAPEQLVDAERADPRSDLYALGVMCYEALNGHAPHQADTPAELRRARLSQPTAPWTSAQGVPVEARTFVEALLARRRRARPQSAEHALRALGEGVSEELCGLPSGALDDDRLEEPFRGPERLFHLRSDAARALRRQSGPSESSRRHVLGCWLSAGIAHWEDGRLVVPRDSLARLEQDLVELDLQNLEMNGPHSTLIEDLAPGAPGRLRRLICANDLEGAYEEGRAVALTLWRAGRIAEALSALEPLLAKSRQGDPSLLLEYTRIALAAHTPADMARALYELRRAALANEVVAPWVALLHAASLARHGDAERALASWRQVPSSSDEALDRWRWAVRVDIAQSQPVRAFAEVVDDAWAWARARGTRTAQADAENWEGLLCYRRLAFERSAELHGRAAEGKAHVSGQLSARANQGYALLELCRVSEVEDVARRLAEQAAACRLPIYEARAEWMLRTIAYRRADDSLQVDLELVDAARHLTGAFLRGQLLFTEAAIAWRAGQRALAHALVGETLTSWRHAPGSSATLLAEALHLITAPEENLPERRRLATLLCARTSDPGLTLQALGALLRETPELVSDGRSSALTLIDRLPLVMASGRRELVSVEEVRASLHTSPTHATDP
ncbi:MAG: protein kinase [Alphaproteobacteria bacterium]|nr:protein kinase [Alphaproteobacteria bacterium]